MANDQSINSKNGNSSSASTPTTSDRPTQTRLPSMRDLLQDVNPTTNRNSISSHHHPHHSNTHHHQTLASSERSTINHRPPSSDDSSSMALDDYPDHVEVADADRRVPSGPGKEIVENWTRTQRLGNDGFNHATNSHITSHESSPRRTSGELDVGRVERSRDAGQAGAAHEWTSVAPPKRSEVAKGGGQYHQQPSYHQDSYPSRSPRQMENPLAPFSRHSHQLATFGAPLSHNQQQVQVQSHSNMLPPVPPGFSSRSRERASTLSIPRPEILQEYPAARFSPTYPPGHPSNQAQLAAHLRQAPGSRESVGSASTAATGRSSLLNSNQYGAGYGYAQGRQWEEHRSRSDSSSSMTTNRSSISAMSPSFKYGHLQGTEMSPKDAYFTNQQMQPINSSPLLFAPLSPKDQPSNLSPQVAAKGYPAVLASPSHASRSENGDHFSSGSSSSYPPSPVSPMFIDGQVNYHPMSTSVPHHGVRGGVRRSWDQTSLRALVSPSGPHPQLPSTTTRHGWTSQSPISQVSGLPSTTGYSSTIPQAPYSAPGGNASGSSSSVSHPSPPVPALSLPPAPERLAHSRRRRKPPASYAYLITQAISSSPTGQMSLKEIYSWISQAHPNHYSLEGDSQGWTNVVRHNLSLNKAFVKVPKHEESGPVKSGKGGLWTLDRAIIEQRANTGQGAGIGLSAALAAGDAIREARAQGRDLPIGSGSSEDNDDQMSIDEATPSPRLSHQDLPFPTAMGPGSTRNLTERSSTATLRGSDPENRNLTRRRSKSHMGTDVGSHSQAPVSPSVLGGPTTPTFSSAGILPPLRHSTSTESSPSASTINRRIAGRPRGHTISNGEIAKQRRTNPPPNATVLQSPSKRKTLDSIEVEPGFEGQSRSTRNIKIRNPTTSNSSPSSSVTHLPTNQLPVKSYSSTHHHTRNLKVMINNSVHQREDGMQDDDAEFTRPTKSPKLSTDLQSLAVEDKDEEAKLRHSVTPTQGQDDEREGQSMKISGLLC